MAFQEVNIGVEGNDGTGDSIRQSFRKVNENFNELYAVFNLGGRITFKDLDDTASVYQPNSVFLVNSSGLFIDNAVLDTTYVTDENGNQRGSINFQYEDGYVTTETNPETGADEQVYNPGKIIISAGFTRVADDTTPKLGGPLSGQNFVVAGVRVPLTNDDQDLIALNGVNDKNYTVDNAVITKGYADQRYITTDIPISIADEPDGVLHYTWRIYDYISTPGATQSALYILSHYLPDQRESVTGHGLTASSNGLEVKFSGRLHTPQALVGIENLYIRVVDPYHLWLFTDKDFAKSQDPDEAEANKIDLTQASVEFNGESDTHTITLATLDLTLEGYFLSDQAVPRKSLVLRNGDTMTGKLFLSDHPGDLAGSGTPNGAEDLQAATKLYVDQGAAYSSPEVLFVSTDGDDNMKGVPLGKEGTAAAYAFRTIGAAAARANELIRTAPSTPGPYIQRLTYTTNNDVFDGTVLGFNIEEGEEEGGYAYKARTLLSLNRTYIQKETIAWINDTYPEFSYDADYCERDIGLLVDAIVFDIYRKIGTNTLTKQAAERYFSSVSGRRAVTIQLNETNSAIQFAKELSTDILLKQLSNAAIFSSISQDASCSIIFDGGLPEIYNDGDLITLKDIPLSESLSFMNGKTFYIKFTNAERDTILLFEDSALNTPFDTSTYDAYGGNAIATIGKIYQKDYSQQIPDTIDQAEIAEQTAVINLWTLIQTIITEGIDYPLIEDTNYGRPYRLYVSNGGEGYLNQTSDTNSDALPGKVVRGTRSRAIGRIIRFVNNDSDSGFGTDLTRFDLNLLSASHFEEGEPLEYANYIKLKEVVIRIEAGNYYEDYPIKVANNVSIKGDEFRRVIVQPKQEEESHIARISQSKWANTYFYRDAEFDGLSITENGTSKFYNQIQDPNTDPDTYQGWFGYHYLVDPSKPINIDDAGAIVVVNPSGNFHAADILEKNREFLQSETVAWINFNVAADNGTFPTNFTYNQEKCSRDVGLIIKALAHDFEYGGREKSLEIQGSYHGSGYPESVNVLEDNTGQIAATLIAMEFIKTRATTLLQGNSFSSADIYGDVLPFEILDSTGNLIQGETGTVATIGNLIDLIKFGFDTDYNPPKRTDEMDVFLLGDTTIIRNLTTRGHGGFMCVLDPDGQILTKSPYTQTASSFSKSINAQTFSGGMFVDAYVGNLPARILNENDPAIDVSGYTQNDPFILPIISDDSADGEKQGLRIREPQLPCPFYKDGIRYQVNAISDYNQASGFALIYLDRTSGPENPADPDGPHLGFNTAIPVEGINIFLQTAGNRSLLGNDFTQVNDLGYGLVVTNGAFSEMVSMFTYYCHAAYYSCNGGEIRSLNGSNGYGNFALVSEGADPNEIPDRVTLDRTMTRPATVFVGTAVDASNNPTTAYTANFEESFVVVYNLIDPPQPDSIITIDHAGTTGILNYRIAAVSSLSSLVGDYAPGTINAVDPVNANVIIRDKTLYRLELRADDVIQTDYFGILQTALTHGTQIEYRDNIDITFNNVAIPTKLVTRPSTAINMDESSDTTYRSLDFQTEDPFGTPLSSELILTFAQAAVAPFNTPDAVISNQAGATALVLESNSLDQNIVKVYNVKGLFLQGDEIYLNSVAQSIYIGSVAANKSDKVRATIEQNFEVIPIESFGQQADGTVETYMDGGCGSTQGDTRLAIKTLPGPGFETDSERVVNPTSPKVFSFKGKTHRVTGYFNDVTQLNISGSLTTSIDEYIANGADGAYTAVGRVTQNKTANSITICDIAGTGTFGNGDTVYRGTSLANLSSTGTTISSLDGQEYAILTFEDADVNLTNVASGLVEPVQDGNGDNFNRIFNAGLEVGAPGEITVAISLLRATGHDFTQIGTGGYNTSNYPNVILGDPIQPVSDNYWTNDVGFQSTAQVWEKKKGRVFWVSTDQYGFFRVGRFFSVDQGTGAITFGGEVGISNANSLGFKKGVTINEFSSDEQFADDSNLAVPTEKAIRAYIKRVLGIDPNNPSIILASSQRIGPGFLPLNGTVAMEGNLNMGFDPNTLQEHRIRNLGTPVDGTDAVNKNYVDGRVGGVPLSKVKNFMIDTRQPDPAIDPLTSPASEPGYLEANEFIVSTGNWVLYLDANSSDLFPDNTAIRNTADPGSASITGTIIQSHIVVDPLYGSVRRISYTLTSGAAPFSTATLVGGTLYGGAYVDPDAEFTGSILPDGNGGSFEEITNAGHHVSTSTPADWNGNDIIATVNRSKDFASISFAIRDDSIVNADVNSQAGIVQSKLSLNIAKTVADDDAISSQADRGSAAFLAANFTASAKGLISLKANGVALGNIAQVSSGVVLGRTEAGTGDVSAISFSDITSGGGSLLKSYFATAGIMYRSSTTGSGAASDWGILSYSTGASASTIAQRDGSGDLKASSLNFTSSIKYDDNIIITSGGEGQVRVGGVYPGSTDFQVGSKYVSGQFVYTSGVGSLQINKTNNTGAALLLGTSGQGSEADTNVSADSMVWWLGGAARYKMDFVDVGTEAQPDERARFYPLSTQPVDLGTVSNPYSIVHGDVFSGYSTKSKYADLAENYLADERYEDGTVLVFGGAEEITVTNTKGDKRVAGVVSTNPAHLMNEALEGEHVTPLALQGRVPCKVIGKVAKGDMLVTSAIPGYAIVDNDPRIGTVLGKAVGEKTDDGKGVVEIVVGRL